MPQQTTGRHRTSQDTIGQHRTPQNSQVHRRTPRVTNCFADRYRLKHPYRPGASLLLPVSIHTRVLATSSGARVGVRC
eukprot:9240238-Pyramimonas_sp.AAC.1